VLYSSVPCGPVAHMNKMVINIKKEISIAVVKGGRLLLAKQIKDLR
jgi:hypothetical protein